MRVPGDWPMADRYGQEACGWCGSQPAVTGRHGPPLCQSCADRADESARHAREAAGAFLADRRPGSADMTEFEREFQP
jgi:hypothetical protein